MSGFDVEIIPCFAVADELPTDGSLLLAFIEGFKDNTPPLSFGPTLVDRLLVAYVGGQQNDSTLQPGWRVLA